MIEKIGITEQGDPVFDLSWLPWVKSGKPAILITKDPYTLYNMIESLDCKLNIIIHCTITGNGGSDIEPNVSNYKRSIDGLVKFVKLFGKDRVVLRIDPILPNNEFIERSKNVLDSVKNILGDEMCRVRISFYDNYKHSEKRFTELGIQLDQKSFNLPIEQRKEIWKYFEYPDICGEQGMPSTPCLSKYDCDILGVKPGNKTGRQRFVCECLSNKIELLKRTGHQCEHRCAYCYLKKDMKIFKKIL